MHCFRHTEIGSVQYVNFTGQAQLFQRHLTEDKRESLDYEPCERCRLRGGRCSQCKAIRTGGGYIILYGEEDLDSTSRRKRFSNRKLCVFVHYNYDLDVAIGFGWSTDPLDGGGTSSRRKGGLKQEGHTSMERSGYGWQQDEGGVDVTGRSGQRGEGGVARWGVADGGSGGRGSGHGWSEGGRMAGGDVRGPGSRSGVHSAMNGESKVS